MKFKKSISVLCVIAILVTSLFCAGITNASADTVNTDGKMLHVTSKANNWGSATRQYTLEKGKKYTFSAEYCIFSNNLTEENSNEKDIFILFAANTGGNEKKECYIATSGRNSCSFEWDAPDTTIKFGIKTNSKDSSTFEAFVWNLKVVEIDTKEEVAPNEEISDTSSDKIVAEWVTYDEEKFIPVYSLTPTQNNWSTEKPTVNLAPGEYTLSFDYYVAPGVTLSTNTTTNFVFKTKASTNAAGDDVFVTQVGDGHYVRTFSVDSSAEVTLEIAAKNCNSSDVTTYFWNVAITNKEGTSYPVKMSRTPSPYDATVIGSTDHYSWFFNNDSYTNNWNTVSYTFKNLPKEIYTLRFDYFTNSSALDANGTTNKQTFKTKFAMNITDSSKYTDNYITKTGYGSYSGQATLTASGSLSFEIGCKMKNSRFPFKVYVWNLRVEDSQGNIFYVHKNSAKIGNNVIVSDFSEAQLLEDIGAMPEIKGAKIKVNNSAAEEQKLKFDIDFSAVASFGEIKQYGFAIAPNESGMTVDKIVNSANKVIKTYDISEGTPSEMSVVVNRNSIEAYGKRVALVAFVTTDKGTYYTDISQKSVMGVMKSIFSSSENLATEGITGTKITDAHKAIAADDDNNKGKKETEIANIFARYTGYSDTEVDIDTSSRDYSAAKTFTAHTFYYAVKGTN